MTSPTTAAHGGTGETPQRELGTREIILVVVVGMISMVVGFGIASVGLAFRQQHYRAEMQLALLPGPTVPPQELADAWEALNRGQAARIAAEVLGQRRWRASAAQSAGVPVDSITITAGAIADTSLIELGVETTSAQAAEQAGESLVREARPVVEEVSGLFVLEILQSAEGTAEPVGTSPGQLLAVASVAGLLLGSGGALMVIRHRGTRRNRSVPHRDARPPDPFPEPFPERYPEERAPRRSGRPSGDAPSGNMSAGNMSAGGAPNIGGMLHGSVPHGSVPHTGGMPNGSGSHAGSPHGPNGVGLTHRPPPRPGSVPAPPAPPVPPNTSTPTRR